MARRVSATLTSIIRHASDAARRDTAAGPGLLAQYVATRDEDAFAELVRLHGPLVWAVCHRVLRKPHDAEDAFQATFLVLARKADRIADPERLPAWLHGVALRAARKVRELAGRRREVPAAEGYEPAAPADARDEIWAVLDEEVARLPNDLRQPVVLCRLQGQTYAEAARQLGCSVTAIFERLERAAGLLRTRLGRRGLTAAGSAAVAAFLEGNEAVAVPVEVTHRAVELALGTAGRSPIATLAADAVVRSMSGSVVPRVAASVLALTIAAGVAVAVLTPVEADPVRRTAAARANLDHLGDPLPPDAVVRIGTERFRTGLASSIEDVAFLPKNRGLVSVQGGKEIRFWKLPDGTATEKLACPGGVGGVAVSADGNWLAAAGSGVYLWDLTASPPKRVWATAASDRRYSAIAFAPDGKSLAVTDQQSRSVILLDATTGEERRTFDGVPKKPTGGMSRVGFSADGRTLYCGRDNEPARAWDVESGKPANLPTEDENRLQLTASPGQGEARVTVEAYFLPFLQPGVKSESRKVTVVAAYPPSRMGGKRVSPDGRYLAGIHRGEITVWDLATGNPVGPEGRIHGGVRQIAFNAAGTRVMTLSLQSEVRVWDAMTGKPIRRLVVGHEVGNFVSQGNFVGNALDTAHFNPNTKGGVPAIAARTSTRWNLETGAAETMPIPGLEPSSSAFNVASPDGKWFAIMQGSGILLRSRDGKTSRTIPLTGTAENTLAFSADGSAIGCTTSAGTVELYAFDGTKRFAAKFREPTNPDDPAPLSVFAIAADGQSTALVVEGKDGASIEIRRVGEKDVRRIPIENRTVLKLAFSPDGKRLAAGTEENQVVVWNLVDGKLRTFSGHRRPVEALAFSPNGERLASGSRDGIGLIWNLGK